MLEIFGKFSFVIIASYASSITLLSALVIETLISKVKTDRELKKKETETTWHIAKSSNFLAKLLT